MPAQRYDVIIVGAGMSGSTLACALADAGMRIALLDKKPVCVRQEQEYDVRVSSINIASQRIFESLGVWDGVTQRRVSPFRDIEVWSDSGSIHFSASEISQTHLGHIIENSVITSALTDTLANKDNVTLSYSTTIDRLDTHDDGVVVVTGQKNEMHSRLLVGADGPASRVREAAGIAKTTRRYHQKAIVAKVQTEHDHAETARQRFLHTGPLAFLPLADGSCSIVWSCDNDKASSVLASDDESFMHDLGEAFEHRLGAITDAGARVAFPLVRQDSASYIAKRTALIGDAVHVIHPLAGLGANLGIGDAACLAEIVCEAHDKKRDIASHSILRRYERWRKGANAFVAGMMDMYKTVFGSPSESLRHTAGSGLTMTHKMKPVKRVLMRHATGISGDLPAIARPSRIY